jgi:hypothetical protein
MKNNFTHIWEKLNKLNEDKEMTSNGAKLIGETENWKIYHITSYSAACEYGKDTGWKFTDYAARGESNYNQYIRDGYDFYFIITKGEYDPRGNECKFAFVINEDDEECEIYNQWNDEVLLDDIPYGDEIKIPGIDLESDYEEDRYFCWYCGATLFEDDVHMGADDHEYCKDCWERMFFECHECEGTYDLDDAEEGEDGELYCPDCFDELN